MEVVKVIPEKILLLVNLPNRQEGEYTQGSAMVTVQEVEGKTVVSLFMNRIYLWSLAGENILRKRRESDSYQSNRKSIYQNNFLTKLKKLAES